MEASIRMEFLSEVYESWWSWMPAAAAASKMKYPSEVNDLHTVDAVRRTRLAPQNRGGCDHQPQVGAP
jgi:hypothetical protein